MSKNDFTNKSILLVVPDFYKYPEMIKRELENRGAYVDVYFEEPPRAQLLTMKKVQSVLHSECLYRRFNDSLYREITKKGKKYDFLVVIRGAILNEKFIQRLKQNVLTEDAKTIYYTWDSMKNTSDNLKITDEFQKCYSFDVVDAKKYKQYQFLPLFYGEEYSGQNEEKVDKTIDICFVGGFSKERYEIIKQIRRKYPKLNTYFRLYIDEKVLQSKKLIDGVYFNHLDMEIITTAMIDANVIKQICSKSKAILDLTHNKQTGLSIRIIESMGMNQKIITDNQYIKEYDFYDEDMIWLIDDENLKLPQEEWYKNGKKFSETIQKQYTIEKWVDKLLGVQG